MHEEDGRADDGETDDELDVQLLARIRAAVSEVTVDVDRDEHVELVLGEVARVRRVRGS